MANANASEIDEKKKKAKYAAEKARRYNEKMRELGLTKVGVYVPERDVESIRERSRALRDKYFREIGHELYLKDEVYARTGTGD